MCVIWNETHVPINRFYETGTILRSVQITDEPFEYVDVLDHISDYIVQNDSFEESRLLKEHVMGPQLMPFFMDGISRVIRTDQTENIDPPKPMQFTEKKTRSEGPVSCNSHARDVIWVIL